MNIFLWVLQVVLAGAFGLAGMGRATQSKRKLAANPRMAWTADFSPTALRAIGVIEVLAALGLILPGRRRQRRPADPRCDRRVGPLRPYPL